MSEEKGDVIDRLAEVAERLLATSNNEAIYDGIAEIKRLRQVERDLNITLHETAATVGRYSKEVEGLTEENESLRVQLHNTELDVARLRGYQDRVNEFDPVSEQQAYADQLPRGPKPPAHVIDGATGWAEVRRDRPWFARRAS